MSCVTTVSFSIVLNGNPGSFFKPKRGLRQGDPLSPYLFLIISEVLSVRITKSVNDGHLLGIKLSRSCPVISHLFFADDALYFLKASLPNCWKLKQILMVYCNASGQLINHEKSSIYFSPNTPHQMQFLMCELLGIRLVDHPGNYLGLPTIWGKSKKEALSYIKDCINRKIEGWKLRTLSPAGKEVLIKSVAMAVPAYPMACFKFPVSICNEINSALGNFWWGYNDTGPKLHWKSWAHMGKSKMEGGMGFRDLRSFNLALLAKQCWRLIQEPLSLWARVLKARYFPLCDFADAVKGFRASWSWASLLEERDIIISGSVWQVGDGLSIDIWKDNWLPPPHSGIIISTANTQPASPVLVNSLIDWSTGSWDQQIVSAMFQPDIALKIRLLPIGDGLDADRLIWPWNKYGSYTVKSGYHWHHLRSIKSVPDNTHTSHQVPSKCWRIIWGLKVVPKIRAFFWRALSGAIPTNLNLFRRKLKRDPLCSICNIFEESIEHILLLCPWTEAVWFGSPLGYRIRKSSITSIDNWILDLHRSMTNRLESRQVLSLAGFLCWSIWKSRCCFLYQGEPLSPVLTITRALCLMKDFWNVSPTSTHMDPLSPSSLVGWSPPPINFIKLNCDAAWNKLTCKVGLGVVARNHQGLCVGGLAKPSICDSVLIAECEAVLEGLLLARDSQFGRVIVSTDSMELITNIRNPHTRGCWKIFPILNKIRRAAATFVELQWEWSPRKANKAAHAAAALATRVVDLNRWASEPPPSLTLVLRNDGLPCPHAGMN